VGKLCKCGRGFQVTVNACSACLRDHRSGRVCKCGLSPTLAGGYCLACSTARYAIWCQANPEKLRQIKRRGRIKHSYGLTPKDYDVLIAKPCGICGTTERRRVCDHDHKTGGVRGALCDPCNQALHFIERPGWVVAARAYLTRAPLALNYQAVIKAPLNATVGRALRSQPCELCGTTDRVRRIDHDHESGLVRGTLCQGCNIYLAAIESRPGYWKQAQAYLATAHEHKAQPEK
jgi:hypothetical protein